MTTAGNLEFLGYDKDNDKAWKHKREDRVVWADDAADAADIMNIGIYGQALEDATDEHGPFTPDPKR